MRGGATRAAPEGNGVEPDFGQIVFVVFASALAGIASSGAPGIAALSMITIILVPLGLPVEVAIVLLVAIDPSSIRS